MPSILPSRSLKSSITLFTLAIFLVSLWSLSLFVSQMLRKDMERQLGEQQLAIAGFGAVEIDAEVSYRIRALEQFSYMIDPALLADTDSLQGQLDKQIALSTLFNEGVLIYRRDGTVIAATHFLRDVIGANAVEKDFVESVIAVGKKFIGAPTPSPLTGKPTFPIAVPIRNSRGYVIGALAGITNLSLPNFLDRITTAPYGTAGSYLVIDPKHRVIVAATDRTRVMQALLPPGAVPALDRLVDGTELSSVYVDSHGVEVLSSAKHIPSADWILLPTLPAAEAFSAIHNLLFRMHIATVLLTLLAGTLTWWMLKRQLSPLLSTVEVMAGMATGQAIAQPLPIVRDDEIGLLIAGFNRWIDLSHRRERALQESEQRFKALHDASFGGIVIHDNGVIIDCNQGICDLAGYSRGELIGMDGLQLIHPKWREMVRRNIRTNEKTPYLAEAIAKDGSVYQVSVRGQSIPYKGRTVRAVEFRDITERKKAEERLQLAANVFSHAREGIMITHPDGRIIDVNAAFTQITGYEREEVLGNNPSLLRSGQHSKAFYASMWSDLKDKGFWDGEIWNRHKNGGTYAVMQNISAVRDDAGTIQYFVSLFSDITAVKAHQRQLEHIAHYDSLTSLPNRTLLADRLSQAMAQASRRRKKVAVAYLDLDGFKEINDTYGHETGDKLLIALSNRMKTVLREGDTLARLGGDEFVAVLLDLSEVSDCLPFLTRLLTAAAHPSIVGEESLQVSASLGVTFYPQDDGVDPDQLLRQADQAMYQAKLAGKNRYHVFDADQDRSVRGHHESIENIRQGLLANEFVLYYQPKVNMRSGRVVGVEALIRWQHPDHGLLLPGMFLPTIEEHPLAVDVGDWVIASALAQLEQWHAQGIHLPISINIGARQLQHPGFVTRLKDAIAAQTTYRPGDLELEVLETSALEDIARVGSIIEACKEFGVSFALDDFGTGYSSLTYLKRLSVAQIKIDRSFVSNMLEDPDDLAILDGVLGLATSFRRLVVAEGVETVDHGAMLLQLGCEIAQGFGIARPMPAEALSDWITSWRPDPSWASIQPLGASCLPLLFAGVELKAWMTNLEEYLKNDASGLKPSDVHSERFAAWLEDDGVSRYGEHPAFTAVKTIYQQSLSQARELCQLHAAGSDAMIDDGLLAMREQREEIEVHLRDLMAHDRHQAERRRGYIKQPRW